MGPFALCWLKYYIWANKCTVCGIWPYIVNTGCHRHHHHHFLFLFLIKTVKILFYLPSLFLTVSLSLRLTPVLPCLWPPLGQSLVRPNTLHPIGSWGDKAFSLSDTHAGCCTSLLPLKKLTEESRDEGQKHLSRLCSFTSRSFFVENTCGRCYNYVHLHLFSHGHFKWHLSMSVV